MPIIFKLFFIFSVLWSGIYTTGFALFEIKNRRIFGGLMCAVLVIVMALTLIRIL